MLNIYFVITVIVVLIGWLIKQFIKPITSTVTSIFVNRQKRKNDKVINIYQQAYNICCNYSEEYSLAKENKCISELRIHFTENKSYYNDKIINQYNTFLKERCGDNLINLKLALKHSIVGLENKMTI